MRFENQTVVITGATGGLGASHARAYYAEGARVVLTGRRRDAGTALAAELGERAHFVLLDVRNPDDWAAAVDAAESAFGPVSILVNNAGVQHGPATIEDTAIETWERTFAINVTGQFLGIRAFTPALRRAGGGSIVNIASTMANVGSPYYAPYVASKWAIRGLTRSAALELGRDNIRVNSLHPGVASTPFIHEPAAPGVQPISELYSPDPFAIPRLAAPDEITRALLFLTAPDAAFVTGTELVVDGGLLLGPALKY